MSKLVLSTAMLSLLLVGVATGHQRYGNDHYTDKYGAKSIRLLQAERAYQAGMQTGLSQRLDKIRPLDKYNSNVTTPVQKGDSTDGKRLSQPARLSDVVSRIMPTGCWKANIDESLMGLSVTVDKNLAWKDVVYDLGRRYGFQVYINEEDCTLYLSQQSLATFDIKPRVEGKKWVLPKGERLSVVLNKWSKTAGWSFEWGLPKDLIIDHPAELYGAFGGETGVIAQVVNSFARSEIPLMYEFNLVNKVLVIRESRHTNFSQQGHNNE